MKYVSLAAMVLACAAAPVLAEDAAPAAPAQGVSVAVDEKTILGQQIDALKPQLKEAEKALSSFRQKVSEDPAVVDAKARMEEAKKAFDAAQRAALEKIPEATEALKKLDALRAQAKEAEGKLDALEKAGKEQSRKSKKGN